LKLAATYHVVIAFDRDGDLKLYAEVLPVRISALLPLVEVTHARPFDGADMDEDVGTVACEGLSIALRLLILNEPTRGIDGGATAQVHKLIDQIADRGVAILMINRRTARPNIGSAQTLDCRTGRN
jgi:hypothetical protein